MTANLRPMNLGEILDRTFQIYRAKFWVFVGIAAIPALAMLVIHLVDIKWLHTRSVIHPFRQPGIAIWSFAVALGFYHISSFFGLLILPAQVLLASNASLGKGGSIQESLRFAVARFRSYLWIAVLKLSLVLVIPEILVLGLIAGTAFIADRAGLFNSNAGDSFAVLIFAFPAIAGCVLFFWLGTCLSLAVPASALEGNAGFRALRRSWALTQRSRFRILFTFLIVSISAWLSMYGLQSVFRWGYISLYRVHPFGPTVQHLYLPAIYLMYSVVTALFHPIYTIALTLIYYDQRIRHEGYDIERMMDAAGLNAPVTPSPGDGPAAPAEAGEGQA
jgi:hypothetical protein